MPVTEEFQSKAKFGTKKTFDPIPEGVYTFQVFDIEGYTDKAYQSDEDVDKYKFTFVLLDDEEFDGELNGAQQARGRRIWKDCPIKWSPGSEGKNPSNLWLIASAAIGHELTMEECRTLNVNSLIGKQLKIGVKVRRKQDGGLKNIADSYYKASRKLAPYEPNEARATEDVPF
jgi:hypothetical protein